MIIETVFPKNSATKRMQMVVQNFGTPGKSNYQIAKENGFIGTSAEWLDSLRVAGGSPVTIPFSFGDVNSRLVTTVLANKTLFSIDVLVNTPFDAEARLDIGTLTNSTEFVDGLSDIDLLSEAKYTVNPSKKVTVETAVYLFLTVSPAVTTGDGLILLHIQD